MRIFKLGHGLSVFVFIMCSPGAVYTEELLAQENGIEEIVVTARYREESLQDAPVAVTAFDQAKIEEAGITSMRDYLALTPGVNLVESQQSGLAFVNIRGLSQTRNADPTVAIVMDGVLLTNPFVFSQELYDVRQIEVLKGPQGALYGRNATGGAISITTREPTNEARGFIRGGGGNGEYYVAQGSVSGPLVRDVLLGRATVSYKNADGWRENITLGTPNDPFEDLSGRARLIWEASSALIADLRFSYSNTEGAATYFVSNAPNFVDSGFPALANQPGNGSTVILPGVPPAVTSLIGDPNNTSVQNQGNILGVDDRETWALSAKIDWSTDVGNLTLISSYDEVDLITAGEQFPYYAFVVPAGTGGSLADAIEVPGSAFAAGLSNLNAVNNQNRFQEAFSHELRLSSADDQRLRWMLGGYMLGTDLDAVIAVNNDTGRGLDPIVLAPNVGGINPTRPFDQQFVAAVAPSIGAPAAIAANPNTNPGALVYFADENDNFAYAFFGQVNYDLLENVEVSFALRYDRDEREQTVAVEQQFLPSFFGGAEGDVRKRDYDAVQPKLTLRYRPTDEVMLYTTYAEGFRSGGFNPSGLSDAIQVLIDAGVSGLPSGVGDSFDKEESQSLELGIKSTLFDSRLTLNAAGYYTELHNAFAFTFVAPLTAQVNRNIDESEVVGFEVDGAFAATDYLTFDFGFGYIDSEIKSSSFIGAAGVDIVGNTLPLNPRTTTNVGATLRHDIGDGLQGYVRADWRRTGEVFFEPENFVPRDPVNLINLRAGLSSDDWEITAWVRNLTDENYIAELTNPNGIAFYARLRQWGLELTKRF